MRGIRVGMDAGYGEGEGQGGREGGSVVCVSISCVSPFVTSISCVFPFRSRSSRPTAWDTHVASYLTWMLVGVKIQDDSVKIISLSLSSKVVSSTILLKVEQNLVWSRCSDQMFGSHMLPAISH